MNIFCGSLELSTLRYVNAIYSVSTAVYSVFFLMFSFKFRKLHINTFLYIF